MLAISSIYKLRSDPVPIAIMDQAKEVTRLLMIAFTPFKRFIPNTVKEKQSLHPNSSKFT